MHKITSIQRQQKNKERVSIFCDGEYFGALDEKTFVESGLKSGDDITDERWRELSVQGENRAAFNKGIKYIERAMKSKKQVRDYLSKKGFEQNAIDYAIDKMAEYSYIDDKSFARMIMSHQINVRHAGKMAVQQALYKNGIDKTTIDWALSRYDTQKQLENAKLYYDKLKKKHEKEPDKYKRKRKISDAMQRRGFTWDTISQIMEHEN